MLARCQAVNVKVDDRYSPRVSRIATFDNGAEVFIATEQGAHDWARARLASGMQEPASGHMLLVEAREWQVARFVEPADIIGILPSNSHPTTLWSEMLPVFRALADCRKIIFFCKDGKRRSFQLALWLLSE